MLVIQRNRKYFKQRIARPMFFLLDDDLGGQCYKVAEIEPHDELE